VSHLMPRPAATRAIDAAVALWVLAWIGLGVAIGFEVRDLTGLSHTVIVDGRAVRSLGHTLGALGSVPLVGGTIGHAARQVQQAGASAVAGGQSSASSVRALSVLLAVAVALLPSVPVVVFYLPLRLERRRESRALREALSRYGGDPAFQDFLARRALVSLSYHRLREQTPHPWSAAADGDRRNLAVAELRRLGLDPALLHDRRSRD
jgi:hypothetical protein